MIIMKHTKRTKKHSPGKASSFWYVSA